MGNLAVNELFQTIQGEGAFTGTPSVFIRLQGCPVGCAWCDTKHTWDVLPDNVVESELILLKQQEDPRYFSASSDQLLNIISQQGYTAKHIVITGGEPCMYDLTELCEKAEAKGYQIQIETSGTFAIKCSANTWVTVSPKINMKGGYEVLTSAMLRANEIKHPIAMQKHVDELDQLLQATHTNNQTDKQLTSLIYLQPISQQQRATELAVDVCIARNWRLSVQVHKYIGVE